MPHVRLQSLSPLSVNWPKAVALYEQAFPPCERRDVLAWKRLSAEENGFHLLQIFLESSPRNLKGVKERLGGSFAGFVSYWELGEVIYVEHFAICEEQRSSGVGGEALAQFCQTVAPRPVVLEVELPTAPMAVRRICFYERHGFKLMDADYAQPPYHAGDSWLPLRLMTTDINFLSSHLNAVKRSLYAKVYGLAHTDF